MKIKLLSRMLLMLITGSCAVQLPAATAAEQVFTFKSGVNTSHWLSQNFDKLTYAAPWFGEKDVAWIADHHFDHIRLPVDVGACLV